MNEKLIELAERCEKAKKPDRELDADIALTQGWTEHPGDNWIGPHGQISVPAFTASLDAALTLVPEGHDWIIEHVNGGLTICARVGHNDPDRISWGDIAALALCAAALRARAAQNAEQRG
jgi:hypothetical protein